MRLLQRNQDRERRVLCLSLAAFFVCFSSPAAKAEETPGTNSAASLTAEAKLSTGSPRLVLKQGASMLVLDKDGMIEAGEGSPYGMYEDDTRFLSEWELKVNGKRATLLKSFSKNGFEGTFLYNFMDELLIKRELLVYRGLNERISIHNYGKKVKELKLVLGTGADFKDMFEVRGQKRERRGKQISAPPARDSALLAYAYRGLDDKDYQTSIYATPEPDSSSSGELTYDLKITPGEEKEISFRVSAGSGGRLSFMEAAQAAGDEFETWKKSCPQFSSDWPLLDRMLNQCIVDLFILRQETPKGRCISAGLPWYAVAFGRDQCITAMQTLPFMPQIAREVLPLLAAYQGKKVDPLTEEAPGRIMHELRLGEMAGCKEIAFRPYYGTVDATPLWLVLLCRYVDASGDIKMAETLWPNVETALSYLEKETAGDGFLYYGGKAGAALSNQAWKDSGDSIMDKAGNLATPPLAVCEVQGYLYESYCGAGKLAARLGKEELARRLNGKADKLKACFKAKFFDAGTKTVALALDGNSRPCLVVSSNPGHLLSSGIVDDEIAGAIVESLLSSQMYSGWGIRTLSQSERRYNPMSYHNGSVWPHDNAMILDGMALRGYADDCSRIFESLVQSADSSDDARLPELFCGFSRKDYDTPVPYLVSCSPQAWASGALLQMLKSSLGMRVSGREIKISQPRLPLCMNSLSIKNLDSAGGRIDLEFKRDPANGKIVVHASSWKHVQVRD